jgi:hypothetical protein
MTDCEARVPALCRRKRLEHAKEWPNGHSQVAANANFRGARRQVRARPPPMKEFVRIHCGNNPSASTQLQEEISLQHRNGKAW